MTALHDDELDGYPFYLGAAQNRVEQVGTMPYELLALIYLFCVCEAPESRIDAAEAALCAADRERRATRRSPAPAAS